MEKVIVDNTRIYAVTTVIVGALVNGKANYLTLGGCGMMSISPPLMYITVNKAHYTNAGIRENGCFSINIPSASLAVKTDYVGLVSGRDTDKSGVFTAFYGSSKKAPMIEECPVNMLCRIYTTLDLPNNDVFIGEIVETYVNADCLDGRVPDMKKINPLMLSGGSYWCLGDIVGTPYKDGRALMKK